MFRRWGTSVFAFATTSTLEMYSESSIAKPLSYAGGYAGEAAHKRQLETVRFWIDVSDPGGLDPGARGRATAMRVRIMHVFIRRKLMQRPEWDLDAWGVPISIGDATLTLMGGSVVPGLALWSVGHQTTKREIEATLHFWRYVGHLLGVQPDWYPRSFEESVQLMYAAFAKRAFTAGRDGEELVESYLPAFAPKPGTPWRKRIRDEVNYRVQIGYTAFWLLPMTYNRHRMPRRFPWVLHPLLQLPCDARARDRPPPRPAARRHRRPPPARPPRALVPQRGRRPRRRLHPRRGVPQVVPAGLGTSPSPANLALAPYVEWSISRRVVAIFATTRRNIDHSTRGGTDSEAVKSWDDGLSDGAGGVSVGRARGQGHAPPK